MSLLAAENAFKRGLVAAVDGRDLEAAACFRQALRLHEQRGKPPQWRYLSYYGLSLARAHGPRAEAIQACEAAVRAVGAGAQAHLNLGRVYRIAGRARDAASTFLRGLELAPGHPTLLAELARVERFAWPTAPTASRSTVR